MHIRKCVCVLTCHIEKECHKTHYYINYCVTGLYLWGWGSGSGSGGGWRRGGEGEGVRVGGGGGGLVERDVLRSSTVLHA